MTFHAITAILTLASICGAVLNARGDVRGFYCWLFTNAAWAIVAIYMGIYAQAALWIIYLGISIYGIRKWRRK